MQLFPAAKLAITLRVLFALAAAATLSGSMAAEVRQEDVDESMIAAAGQGDMTTFNIAIGLGANLNAVDRHGNNAVLAATRGDRTELLRTLLDKGVDPNKLGGSGFTPLTYAAMEGSARKVQLLLKAGARPNQPNALGETPLHLAVQFGRVDVIALLAASGSRVDTPNAVGETALISAIRANQAEAFAALLALGAATNVNDRNSDSALVLAIQEDRERMALALVEKGARFDPLPRHYSPLQLARFMGHTSVIDAMEKRETGER